jgi:uncharacterized phiE125 gp8 family phage protein
MINVNLTTSPAELPVTLTEVKNYCKIDFTTDDDLLNLFIGAATQGVEKFTRRALITQTYKLVADYSDVYNNNFCIDLLNRPIQSVTTLKIYDLDNAISTIDAAKYFLDVVNARLVIDSGFTNVILRENASFEVEYVAGYGLAASVPQTLKVAILMYVSKMYDERIICELPVSCENILKQWVVYG